MSSSLCDHPGVVFLALGIDDSNDLSCILVVFFVVSEKESERELERESRGEQAGPGTEMETAFN